MKENLSLKWMRFFNRWLPVVFTLNDVGENVHVSERDNLFFQIVANLP